MTRPNLVLFMPDQLRAGDLGCFGHPTARTPHIDALAARGTRFTQAFTNHPVCGPSRVSLMTGWYPHVRGHRTLTHLIKPWEPNLLRLLKDSGYHVAWVGQRGDTFAPGVTEQSTHFCGFTTRPEQLYAPSPHPPGSKLYDAFLHGKRESTGPVLDFDEACTQTAEAFLAESPPEPFVLFVALIFPHLPFAVEDPWYGMHDPADVPPPISPDACSGKPSYHAAIREKSGLDRLTAEDWAEIRRTYYGMVSRVDDQLGRVLGALETGGYRERTATFFFTDHGEYLGDYGLVEKWPSGLERCLVQNPLIVELPARDAGGGRTNEALVETVDLLPTLLELAEAEATHTHFGRSLLPLLRGEAQVHRDAAFSEGGFRLEDEPLFEPVVDGPYRKKGELQHESPRTVGKAIALRDATHTYVYRLYEGDELYDRVTDPDETRNLADLPEHRETVRTLRDRVLAWLLETSDVIPWQRDPRFPKIPNGWHDRPQR